VTSCQTSTDVATEQVFMLFSLSNHQSILFYSHSSLHSDTSNSLI